MANVQFDEINKNPLAQFSKAQRLAKKSGWRNPVVLIGIIIVCVVISGIIFVQAFKAPSNNVTLSPSDIKHTK